MCTHITHVCHVQNGLITILFKMQLQFPCKYRNGMNICIELNVCSYSVLLLDLPCMHARMHASSSIAH